MASREDQGSAGLPAPPARATDSQSNTSSSALEASRLMPPPAAVGGRGGRGRNGKRRGPGRPPNSERQGPPAASSAAGRGSTTSSSGKRAGPGRPPNSERQGPKAGHAERRRGPGRPPGKRKKLADQQANKPKRKYTKKKSQDDHDNDQYSDASVMEVAETVYPSPKSAGGSGYETDPETSLDVAEGKVSTIHWDPTEGNKIGWKTRLLSGATVQDGRITRYDPYSHKHKIEMDLDEEDVFQEAGTQKKRKHKKAKVLWLRLQHTDTQLATRLVWAHVKGYAWWPAMVMELTTPDTSSMASPRDGYVFVHFIGAPEVATLRDSPDCIRPFSTLVADPVIEKSKRKRNAKAIAQAQGEEVTLQHYKNQAARHFARKAFAIADPVHKYLGKRVRLFSSDINYPDGATVIGTVRQYSSFQKKWLVAFEVSYKVKHKLSAMWINLQSKDCSITVLEEDSDKAKKHGKSLQVEPKDLDLVPFLFGFDFKLNEKPKHPTKAKKKGEQNQEDESEEKDSIAIHLKEDAQLNELMTERCRACVDGWSGDYTITCTDCGGFYHLGCVDPPVSKETYQRMAKDSDGNVTGWTCSRCKLCLGCYQKDIVFGSHPLHPVHPSISFPPGESLNLCSMCVKAYEADKFCPNCAHSWDDVKYQKVLDQLDEDEVGPPLEPTPSKKQRRKSGDNMAGGMDASGSDASDAISPITKGMPPNTPFANGILMNGARIDRAWYNVENNVYGYNEGHMLVCDGCDLWVHAGCGGLTHEEYEMTSEGGHPIYSKEFLCRVCCRKRCVDIIERLQKEDMMMLFAVPVTEKVAPNYRDVIKKPMDLQTMMKKAKDEEYLNYAWVRDDFALMVFNALTFNRFYTKFWNEAKRFYEACLKVVFAHNMIGKAAPPGQYDEAIEKNFAAAETARQMEEERVQQDDSTEKKDLVAGSEVVKVTLPPLRQKPPDESSCLPFQEVKVKPVDAYYCAWMDCCFTCGSSGASDTMIFCVDCGEAFHSFCANVPIHSMDVYSVAGWRCPNCKVCEISGDVPVDELRMLFCEMCDRAFSLDLLDPPLLKAPSGLWICGQCVDCKVCKNTSEPIRPAVENNPAMSRISLKYWSRNPEKCYRCGGCDGIRELIVGDKLECQVCKEVMRTDDDNFASCEGCKSKVHSACDRRAEDFLQQLRTEELIGSRSLKGKAKARYQCPKCLGVKPEANKASKMVAKESIKIDYATADTSNKADMHAQAWQTIVQGGLQCEKYSPLELHGKLLHQMDWQTREMWRDEYISVVNEAIHYYVVAKTSNGDPRIFVQDITNGKLKLPLWLGQRAGRFLVILKRNHWDTKGFSPKGIEGCVFAAKLAAAFLAVVCQAMKLPLKDNIKSYERVERLLKAPLEQGVFEIPMDKARCESQKENSSRPADSAQTKITLKNALTKILPQVDKSILSSPLCGWGGHTSSAENPWRDPRECCLCHLCGDRDGGFAEPEDESWSQRDAMQTAATSKEAVADSSPSALVTSSDTNKTAKVARLGRLLPMSEGQWVHASCALWSSEVWESPRGGLINAMEKARSRGAQLKCFGCGRAGATVGCNKHNCSFNYHFPCAKACGAVFTSKQQMFCANHKDSHQSGGSIIKESFEAMKTLIVAPEKLKTFATEKDSPGETRELCSRVGSLVVHSLGKVVSDVDFFHSEDYIYPEGYVATRIFWSTVTPRSRTVYILKVDRNMGSDGASGPLFTIIPGDAPSSKIRGRFVSQVYKMLVDRVRKINADHFSQGDLFSKLPMVRKSRKKFFALNGPQFFGFGLNHIRERLEALPGVEAVVAPLQPSSSRYRFCFVQPSIESIVGLQRKRAAVAAERALENSTGCARTEGCAAVARSGGSGRITRALVRSVAEENPDEAAGTISAGGPRRKNVDPEKNKLDKKRHQAKYNQMKSVPMEDRLVARRSHIHGWGLFTKLDIKKDDMITEYMGEVVRQCVADKREAAYEISGEGSCYMFRLDLSRIVDATMIGCMARFMNHCCQPNAYAKIIIVDTEFGVDKKIAVFASRDIAAGEEITYDYKFPVEDGSLRCTCGAPNCIGRMN